MDMADDPGVRVPDPAGGAMFATRLGSADMRRHAWVAWVAGSAIGSCAGLALGGWITSLILSPLPRGGFAGLAVIFVGLSLAVVTIPALAGVAQGVAIWFLVRRRRIVIEWCGASIAPAAVFVALLFAFGVNDWLWLFALAFGGMVGIGQGYALFRNLGFAAFWSVGCGVTLVGSGFVLNTIGNLFPNAVLALICWGLAYGVCTAIILVVLIRAETM